MLLKSLASWFWKEPPSRTGYDRVLSREDETLKNHSESDVEFPRRNLSSLERSVPRRFALTAITLLSTIIVLLILLLVAETSGVSKTKSPIPDCTLNLILDEGPYLNP